MQKKELTEKIEELLKCQKNLQKKMDALYELFGGGSDKFEDVCWEGFQLAVQYLEELAEDKHQIIGHFIIDCGGGENPQPIKIHGEYTKKIDSTKTVIKLMEKYRD